MPNRSYILYNDSRLKYELEAKLYAVFETTLSILHAYEWPFRWTASMFHDLT
jgi:hypothetical protein